MAPNDDKDLLPDQSRTRARRRPRNADQSIEAAHRRVETARVVADAVVAYHEAADKIDEGDRLKAEGTEARLSAIRTLKDSALKIAEISELTGLSESRIQTLLRPDTHA